VSFLGFRPDVADHIAAADAFSLSSLWEGVPLAAQEAILLGTPVVGTDVGGMRELISNKVSGRLVPPGDPVALAAALDEVLSSPERAAAYARAARDGLHERFSTDAMLERLREAYAS
jgi:glycosyltransferase involved in cell wall biosynthesis